MASYISCFHVFVKIFMVDTAQGATKMFTACARMFISDKYRRPWSDTAHYARCLTRACDRCPLIRQVFSDEVTYVIFEKVKFEGRHCNWAGPDCAGDIRAFDPFAVRPVLRMCSYLSTSALGLAHIPCFGLNYCQVSNNLDPNDTPSDSASRSDPSCLPMLLRSGGCTYRVIDYFLTIVRLIVLKKQINQMYVPWQ